jgi:hypothetical protein
MGMRQSGRGLVTRPGQFARRRAPLVVLRRGGIEQPTAETMTAETLIFNIRERRLRDPKMTKT